jgi:hypothetical protein
MRTQISYLFVPLLALAACSSSDKVTASQLDTASVTTAALADHSVTNAKLADKAVDARVLAGGSVAAPALAQGAVTAAAIADGAVGTSAIASGAVGTAQLAKGAVTADRLAANAVDTLALQDHAVSANKLASNAAVLQLNGMTGNVSLVGSSNISVTPSGSTITVGLTGPVDAATLGGVVPGAFARKVPNLVTVAPSGGDFTTITAALTSITDASATNLYVIRIAPGIYSERVQLKPYVSLVGAGIDRTTITSVGGTAISSAPTLIAADNADVSKLTIQSDTAATAPIAVAVYGSGSNASLRQVAIRAMGGTTANYAVYAVSSALLSLESAQIDAEAGAAPSPSIYGINALSSSTVRCDACQITAPSGANQYAVSASGASVLVGASLLSGSVNSASGTIRCPASYDANYNPVSC